MLNLSTDILAWGLKKSYYLSMSQKCSLIMDLRPHNPLVAVLSGGTKPAIIEAILSLENIAALKAVCHEHNPKSRYTRAIAACYPESRFLYQETLENPSKARESAFFEQFFKSHYEKDLSACAVAILNPVTGLMVDLDKVVPKELAFAGAASAELQKIQADVVAQSVYPDRLELGTLSTMGGIIHYQKAQQIGSSAVVLEWGMNETLFIVCSGRRVELLRSIPFGYATLLQRLKTALSLKDDASAAKILEAQGFDFNEMGPVLLKDFIKQLQASAGFFEVQTGQALKHLIPILLPPNLGWMEQVVSQYMGLDLLSIDYQGWMNTLGVKTNEAKVPLGSLNRGHLGIFGLLATSSAENDGEKRTN